VAEVRCEDTELLVEQCGCKIHRPEPKPEPAYVTSTFQAQYAGRCAGCGEEFIEGEWVGFDSRDRLLCTDCLEEL
jgi:hypothetical protein